MRISVGDAEGQFQELIRRAEAGEEVVLTRSGRETVRLVASRSDGEERRRVLKRMQAAALNKAIPGPEAARSQDFLYDEDGLPG
jgi:prevent-host-death family protein